MWNNESGFEPNFGNRIECSRRKWNDLALSPTLDYPRKQRVFRISRRKRPFNRRRAWPWTIGEKQCWHSELISKCRCNDRAWNDDEGVASDSGSWLTILTARTTWRMTTPTLKTVFWTCPATRSVAVCGSKIRLSNGLSCGSFICGVDLASLCFRGHPEEALQWHNGSSKGAQSYCFANSKHKNNGAEKEAFPDCLLDLRVPFAESGMVIYISSRLKSWTSSTLTVSNTF